MKEFSINRTLMYVIFTIALSVVMAKLTYNEANIGYIVFMFGLAIGAGYLYGSFQALHIYRKQMEALIEELKKGIK